MTETFFLLENACAVVEYGVFSKVMNIHGHDPVTVLRQPTTAMLTSSVLDSK